MFLHSRPSYLPLIKVANQASFGELANIDSSFSVGVGVFGSAAAYAMVWELGSRTLLTPGPKTTWGVNRKGEKAILTKQAPAGYVGIHSDDAYALLSQEMATVKWDMSDLAMSKLRLEVALDNTVLALARMISDSAPVDTGDLRSQIMSISTDEEQYLDIDDDVNTLLL